VGIELPEWVRLQKALSVEAEKGFTDLVGNQYRFSEFICLSFGKTPDALVPAERRQWQKVADQFALYPEMTSHQRQHLVAETRRFLHQLEQGIQRRTAEPEPAKFKSPRTTSLVQSTSRTQENRSLTLDLPLSKLEEVGVRKSGYLARLGLLTVRDILFYYPSRPCGLCPSGQYQ
jgi:ATP-dependent DNA helicase RecG